MHAQSNLAFNADFDPLSLPVLLFTPDDNTNTTDSELSSLAEKNIILFEPIPEHSVNDDSDTEIADIIPFEPPKNPLKAEICIDDIGHDVISQSSSDNSSLLTDYLLYDGHGSTRLLTNSLGSITDRYSFDAYGKSLETTYGVTNTPMSSLLFSGESFDVDLQQQYLRARWYDQDNGRFNRLDPFSGINDDPQSLHKYAYAHGDPINGIDPDGLFSIQEVFSVQGISKFLRTNLVSGIVGGISQTSGLLLKNPDSSFIDIVVTAARGFVIGTLLGPAGKFFRTRVFNRVLPKFLNRIVSGGLAGLASGSINNWIGQMVGNSIAGRDFDENIDISSILGSGFNGILIGAHAGHVRTLFGLDAFGAGLAQAERQALKNMASNFTALALGAVLTMVEDNPNLTVNQLRESYVNWLLEVIYQGDPPPVP